MELRIFQSLFDRQSEITSQLLEGINNTHVCARAHTHTHTQRRRTICLVFYASCFVFPDQPHAESD